jgi:excisionase family DNA binding protein
MKDGLMDTAQVAEYLGVGQVTVWRWCRDGILPCSKIGRSWRVRRSALDEFIRRSERSFTLAGRLRAFIEVPDNVLAIAQDADLMKRLDAAFFRVAEPRGGKLIKYQRDDERLPPLDEVREEMTKEGLEISRLEAEGRLSFVVESGEGAERIDEVRRLLDETSQENRPVWVSFDWDLRMGIDKALEQQRVFTDLVEGSALVIKTAVLEEDLDEWPGATQRRAQVMHSGTIWLSREGLALSRVTPPPTL